jgi:acetylglutamate kinase
LTEAAGAGEAAVAVVKVGGAAIAGGADPAIEDVRRLADEGVRLCVVHGGGPEITAWCRRLGIAARFVDGLRHTDEDTLAVVEMVLSGRVGKALAQSLGRAVSVSGRDGGLFSVEPLDRARYGLVGRVAEVRPELLGALLAARFLPVVAPLGPGADGALYNVNADEAAAAVAAALGARRLVLATDVPGVLVPGREGPLPVCGAAQARELIETGVAGGGMRPKLEACLHAVEAGVSEAWVVDGRRRGAVRSAALGRPGAGTCVREAVA